jgi:YD repeat-containing protein
MHAAAAVRTFATTVFTPVLRRILPLVVLLAAAGYGGSIAGSGDARAEWFKPLGTYPGCGYVAALNGNYCDTVADSCEAIATYRRGRLTGMAQNTGSVTCQLADASVDWDVTRPTCPAGSVIDVDEMSGCKATTNLVSNAGCLAAGEPGKSPGHGGQAAAGDPIDVINGNSHQCETDYRSAGPDVLEFKRHYNSRSWDKGSLGKGWSHSFSPWLQVSISHLARIYPRRPQGMIETFGNSLGRNPWHPKDTRMTGKLYEYGWGYTYTTLDGTVESYDTRGRLLNIVRRNGYTQTMVYDGAGNLIGVTDSHGRSLSFTYGAAGRMTAMIDPDGRITAYDYATVYTRTGLSFRTNNHGKVTYPDADDDALGAADVLFTRLDGPDGATAATDESASAHPLNFVGAAQVDTSQSRFGGASALFDGTATTYISAPDSADWHFGAGAFTVEAWVRFSSAAYMTLIKQFDSTGDQRSWAIDWTTDNQIRLRYSPDGTDAARVTLAAGWAPTPGAWHHIAVDRDSGNNLRIYADGKVLLNTVVTAAFHDSTADLQIGRVHNGWIDDVRITKGEARYGGAWPAAASRANNPFKTYLYEDPNHFAALTGIVDETGVRTPRDRRPGQDVRLHRRRQRQLERGLENRPPGPRRRHRGDAKLRLRRQRPYDQRHRLERRADDLGPR